MSEGRRYHVLGVLGRGGFGTVYRADLLGDGSFVRPVALKVLNPEVEGVTTVAARLRDEARLLGRIRHRAIVQVDGLIRLEDRWTVVMEYVHGADLSRVIDAGRVPPRCAAEIIGEAASALHVVHTWVDDDGRPLGILHRDIKPHNVLLTAAGEVKVLDFGVARADLDTREAHTRGMRFGSPGYLAPERADGEERPEGDVYSLGVVFYELLAGRSLGKGSIRQDRHAAHLTEAFGQLPELDPALDRLLRTMLAWEPDHRPSSREVESQCRELSARLDGPFLRDWAERTLPPILAVRSLGDIGSEFSTDILTERMSMPLETPGPAPARGDASDTFASQTYDASDLAPVRAQALGSDRVPPASAARPATDPARALARVDPAQALARVDPAQALARVDPPPPPAAPPTAPRPPAVPRPAVRSRPPMNPATDLMWLLGLVFVLVLVGGGLMSVPCFFGFCLGLAGVSDTGY